MTYTHFVALLAQPTFLTDVDAAYRFWQKHVVVWEFVPATGCYTRIEDVRGYAFRLPPVAR